MKRVKHTAGSAVAVAMLATIVLVTACSPRSSYPTGGPGPRPTPPIPPAQSGKPHIPQTGALLGSSSYYEQGGQTAAQRSALLNKRDADAGRPYDIQNNFYSWDKPFPGFAEQDAISHNRTPMISWNGTTTLSITSGQQDAVIRTRARAMRDLRVPTFLRFFWEMDGHKGQSLADGNPQNFIAAWRHMYRIFQEEGATNVAWVWAPTNFRFGDYNDDGPKWYPGDDVVDWIGIDGYNWAPTVRGYGYESFEQIMADWYPWAAARDKPLMVAEFGAVERNPGDKAAWIQGMLHTLKTKYTRIKAVVYFDLVYSFSTYRMQWPLDTSPQTYAAWNQVARDPYMNTRGR